MKKTKDIDAKPRSRKRPPKPWESFEWERIESLEYAKDKLMATAAELQTAVDALTASVAKVAAEVAALKAVPPVVQNVEQTQLDANTAAITDATNVLDAV